MLEFRTPHISWLIPQEYLKLKIFTYIDLAIAKKILVPEAPIEAFLTVCYLSAIARHGHLCLKINDHQPLPDPKLFFEWDENGNDIAQENLLHLFNQQIILGSKNVLNFLKTPDLIIQFRNAYYLNKFWIFETNLLKSFQTISQQTPFVILPESRIQEILNLKKKQERLTDKQQEAIAGINHSSLILITGGPGTGKTYTAGQLIDVVLQALGEEANQTFKMSFAAPTGKAAANLKKSLVASIQKQTQNFPYTVSTLHSLLQVNSLNYETKLSRLDCDLLIVDEASMIDTKMMVLLLSSLKKGSRLVLLGDRYQLPPINEGCPFTDMIEVLKKTDRPPIELKECLRAELKDLVEFAEAIKRQDLHNCLNYRSSAIEWHSLDNNLEIVRHKIIRDWKRYFNFNTPEDFLKTFKKYGLLCGLRQGVFGVDALNEYCHRYFDQNPSIIHPIIIIENDKKLDLYNGQMGVAQGSKAYFQDKDSDFLREIPLVLLPKYEWAYCLSVHKSQGSEFEKVVLILPEGSEVFGKEMLYTAVTRTRKNIELWTSLKVFEKMLHNNCYRMSSFIERSSN